MSTMTIKGTFCSVTEAAKILGCSEGHMRQLLITEKVAGEKLNEKAWAVVRESVLEFAKQKMTTGRPRKNSA